MGDDAKNGNAIEAVTALDVWAQQILMCTVRGALSCIPNVKPEIILVACCRALGKVVATLYVGDEAPVLNFRRQCRDAFAHALMRSAIGPVPSEARPPADAPAPRMDS